jgi:gliding motility-associated-like protein
MKKLLLFSVLLFLFTSIKAQNNFINQDSVFAQSADCPPFACIDSIQFFDKDNFTYRLDGQAFNPITKECDSIRNLTFFIDLIKGNNELGPWTLDSFRINDTLHSLNTFTTFQQLLDSLNVWDSGISWTYESPVFRAFSNLKKKYSDMYVTGGRFGTTSNALFNTGTTFRGISFRVNPGFHQLIVNDTFNLAKDTLTLRVACIQKDTIRKTITTGSNSTYSMSTSQLLGAPQSASFKNLCVKPTTHVNFTGLTSPTISYTGVTVGADTACLKICDQYGICDTAILIVTAQSPPVVTGTRRVVFDNVTLSSTKARCDIDKPSAPINFFKIVGQSITGKVGFSLDTVGGCINFTGTALGTDSARIIVCNTSGTCDTTVFFITTVIPVAPQGTVTRFNDFVTIGAGPKSRCDIVKPSGTINFFKILSQSTTGKVTFALDTINGCTNFTGLTAGIDSIRIGVCNTSGTCDTTVYYITAKILQDTPRTAITDLVTIGAVKQRCDIQKPTGTGFTYVIESKSTTGHVGFVLDNASGCINFTGNSVGQDSVRILTCNSANSCVRTIFYVNAQNAVVILDTPRVVLNKTVTIGTPLPSCDIAKPSTGTIAPYTIEIQSNSGHVSASIDNVGGCMNFTGLTPGQDSFRVLVCNTLGTSCVRTVYYVTAQNPVVVTQGRRTTKQDSVIIGQPAKTRTDLLKPTGIVNAPIDICAYTRTHVQFTIDQISGNLSFFGLTAGTDSICLKICDAAGTNCDTTIYYVKAIPVNIIYKPGRVTYIDSVAITGLPRQLCNLKLPPGPITRFENQCPQNSGRQVQFTLDQITKCVIFKGLSLGVDSACILVCDAAGNCDTTFYLIQSKLTISPKINGQFIIKDTITEGVSRKRCDLEVPDGAILFNAIINQSNPTNVAFSYDAPTKCITYQGVSRGIDTASVRICNVDGICDTTVFIIETVSPPVAGGRRVYYFTGDLKVGDIFSKCDLTRPFGATTMRNICLDKSNKAVRFDLNASTLCVTYTVLAVGVDTACIEVCAGTVCDTTYMYVTGKTNVVPTIKTSDTTFTIKIYERITFCPDTTELAGSPVDLIKFSKVTLFDNTAIDLKNDAKKCVVIGGLSAGKDTIYIAIRNQAGFFDTTRIFVTVLPDTLKPKLGYDSLTLKIGELGKICPDQTELWHGTITGLKNCTTTNVTHSTMLLNAQTKCVDIRGTSAGRDTMCVAICNSDNICDTTIIYVKVTTDTVKPIPSTEVVILDLGKDSVFTNIDITQIIGSIDTVFDACPGNHGTIAQLTLDRIARTVTIKDRGRAGGPERMCIVVCDTTNGRVCDTTYLDVTFRDPTVITPIVILANDDLIDSVKLGTKNKPLFLYDNDTLKGRTPVSLTIVTPPTKGTVDTVSFQRGVVNYSVGRSPYFCGTDSFRYKVCVLNGADTVCSEANVVVTIVCSDVLKVVGGFSPNGDNNNEFFFIDGLSAYPDNTVLVFNRWGNEVLKAKNYENNWNGTWKDKNLPDGTYFYLIRDDTKGEILQTGWVVINR